MSEEEQNANAFMLAISAIEMSSLTIVEKYRAIMEMAEAEL